MLTKNRDNTTEIKLPNTPYIDTALGLRYCNNNHHLYFKVLKNFVKRYQNLNLVEVKDRKRTIHTLKGITATLGMTSLSKQLIELEKSFNSTLANHFQQELFNIVNEIAIL